MICFSFKITENFAFEASFLNFVRSFKDGVTLLDLSLNLDLYEADHKPEGNICLTFLNMILFDLRIYNVNHVEKNVTPFKCPQCGTEIRFEDRSNGS